MNNFNGVWVPMTYADFVGFTNPLPQDFTWMVVPAGHIETITGKEYRDALFSLRLFTSSTEIVRSCSLTMHIDP